MSRPPKDDCLVRRLPRDVQLPSIARVDTQAGTAAVGLTSSAPIHCVQGAGGPVGFAIGQPAVVEHIWDDEVSAFLAHNLNVLTFDEDGPVLALDSFLDPTLMS